MGGLAARVGWGKDSGGPCLFVGLSVYCCCGGCCGWILGGIGGMYNCAVGRDSGFDGIWECVDMDVCKRTGFEGHDGRSWYFLCGRRSPLNVSGI